MSQSINSTLIAPFKTGLDTDLEPWIAPIDSFSVLDNINVKHGHLEKRLGLLKFADLEPMAATVNLSDITQADPGVVTTAAAHGYATGDKVYLKGITGMTELNNKIYNITVTAANTFSIDEDTTSFSAYTGGPGTCAVVDSATDRVMGITQYIEPGGQKTTIAFNANRAYRYDGTAISFVRLDAANISSGDEYDYFWATNWQSGGGLNRLYFTNGKVGSPAAAPTVDGIRYYEGASSTTTTTAFNPTLGPSRTLIGAKLIFSIGQRLVVLNTYEYDTLATTNHPQRARWCAKQNPGNWNDVVAGGGGYADAATGDQIVSARALQNQIIVFFTNSVWALSPTADPNRAFKWQRINDFRACDGKMASVGYDKYAIALGIRGITVSNQSETRRVDDRIQSFTTNDINVNEFGKVFCARNYANKRTWSLYNNSATVSNENDKALIYDDESSAFFTYTIDLNCLGYGSLSQDYTLADFTAANNLDLALNDFGDEDLFSYFWQDNAEVMLGGDIYGSIFMVDNGGSDGDAGISSELMTAAWNPYKDQGLECQMNYVDIYLDTDLKTTATIDFYKDTEVSPYETVRIDFLPNMRYITSIVNATRTNPVQITVPSHGLSTGDEVYIYGVNGMNAINSGESGDAYTVIVINDDNVTLDGIDGTTFDAYTFGGAIYRNAFYKTKTWKRVYAGGIGTQHRMRLTSSGADRNFVIHAFRPAFKPISKRSIN